MDYPNPYNISPYIYPHYPPQPPWPQYIQQYPVAPAPAVTIHPDWLERIKPPANSRSHPTIYSALPPTSSSRREASVAVARTASNESSQKKTPSLFASSSTSGERPAWLDDQAWPTLGNGSFSTPQNPIPAPSNGEQEQQSVSESQPRKERKSLDRYAAVYQPAWLKSLPPPKQVITLPLSAPFPPFDYAPVYIVHPEKSSSQSLEDIHRSSLLAKGPAQVSSQYQLKRLRAEDVLSHPGSYASHFTYLLSLDLFAQAQEAHSALLHAVKISSWKAPKEGGIEVFKLTVPGIREDSPRLQLGDSVFLQALHMKQKSVLGDSAEAEVVGMLKARGEVFVKSPTLPNSMANLMKKGKDVMFQVSYKASATTSCAMQDAVGSLDKALSALDPVAGRWLFPITKDYIDVQQDSPYLDPWSIDFTLNKEQASAVFDIASRDHPIPYLISGPPGTGKTKTLIAAILAILAVNPKAHILACAPSNPAADTIVKRLIPHLQSDQMFRLNPPNRTFAEVPDDVLRYCFIEDNSFALPTYETLMRYSVVITTCLDAAILKDARAANAHTMTTESTIYNTLHAGESLDVKPHWTHLLVDEAGQASEPEIAIPLTVVLPPQSSVLHTSSCPTVVLCGDVHQLGPIIASPEARQGELDISLLERLFELEVYSDHPMARKKLNMLNNTGETSHSAPFCNLLKNYRSLPEILWFPSVCFYDDTLLSAAKDVQRLPWSGLPNPNWPIAFIGCDSEENWIEEGASWYNLGEIDLVVKSVQSLLADIADLKQEQIAIITPWREQVWRLRGALRKHNLAGVDVGNVETYQGREFRVTIISCVRSNRRFVENDHQANMGLIFERKRFNVAVTRAKELLVIIGNGACLSIDPFWNGFLQFCLRNKAYRGPELELRDDGACMSRFESKCV